MLSFNVLREIFNRSDYNVYLEKVGDKNDPDNYVSGMSLADYMF